MPLHLGQYLEAFREARSVEDLIPLDTFVNGQTCYTKTGSAVTTFSIDPIDDECLGIEERLYAVRRFIAACNLLDPSIRQYQYVFKTRSYRLPSNASAAIHPQVAELESRRHAHLRENAVGGTIEIFHAIEAILPATAQQLARLSPEKRRLQYRRLLNELDTLARGYEVALSDVLSPRRLDKNSAFGLFHRLLHPGDTWDAAPQLRGDSGLARQLRKASVYWDDRSECLRIGRRCVRVYTLQDLPDETMPNLFGGLLGIDADMDIISTWQARERIATRDELNTLRTLVINFERSGIGTKAAIRRDPTLAQDLRNAGVTDDLTEINEVLGQLRRKMHTGRYSLTVLLHGERNAELDGPAAEIDKVFRLPMAQLHEEVGGSVLGNAIPIFFSCLPGNRWGLRETNLRNDHYAELSQIWSCDTGERNPEAGKYCNVYETRPGPLHFQSTHYNLVAAEVVIGMTRSGKTGYQEDRISALQAKRPLTRIYDVGGSYETLAAYFCGSILRCSLGEWTHKLNPFYGNVKSRNFREFCFQFVKALAESSGYKFEMADDLQLYEKLEGLFILPPKHRRLKVLRANIEGPVKDALTKWVEGGQYGILFDHAEDDFTASDFQIYEFEQTEDGVPAPYVEGLQLLLIYRDTRIVLDPANRTRIKHFTFDECASHWKRPQVAELVKRILKTFQKRNGMLSLVTQNPEDMGALEPFILQNCSSFAFFPNPKIEDITLRNKFGFDDTRLEIFRSLVPREFLYHALRGTGDLWKVLKLTMDPYRYWMFSTSPHDVAKREAAIEKYGSPMEALKVLAAGGAA